MRSGEEVGYWYWNFVWFCLLFENTGRSISSVWMDMRRFGVYVEHINAIRNGGSTSAIEQCMCVDTDGCQKAMLSWLFDWMARL